MRIISKWKDYYDYLKGIYGEDEKLILDRRHGFAKFDLLPNLPIVLYIANKKIEGYCDEAGRILFGSDDLEKVCKKIDRKKQSRWDWDENSTHVITSKVSKYAHADHFINSNLVDDPHKTNDKEDCPIVINQFSYRSDYSRVGDQKKLKMPRLQELGAIPQLIPAHDLWVMVSQWLSERITRNEKQVPIGDDKLRIESHGFDYKTSFRGKR